VDSVFKREKTLLVTSEVFSNVWASYELTHARNVIWMADNNYRIDLDNGTVRSLAEADELDALFAADQVRARIHVFAKYRG
jgi:hypothetical protein